MPQNINFRSILAVPLLLGTLAACSTPVATTHELDIVSGQFAIPSKGRVVSVDLVRFGNYMPRYNEAARTASTLWLRGEGSGDEDLGDLLERFVGEVAYQIVSEVEENIRQSNCIYTIGVESELFKEQLINTFETGVGGDKDFQIEELLRDLDGTALRRLNRLPDAEYEVELERLYQEEFGGGNLTGSIEEISVAAQCLIGLHIGDETSLFFFGDRIAISPA